MGANSDLKDKWSSTNEIRRDPGSKSTASHKKEEKPELQQDSNQTRPKSSPETQIKKSRKIPRLRPRTAFATAFSDNSNTKFDQNQTKNDESENITSKQSSGLAQKKSENDGEQNATENSSVKNNVKKFGGENNAVSWNLDGYFSNNANAWNSNTETSNVKMNSGLDVLTIANVVPKSKEQRKKRNDVSQTASDANQTGSSGKNSFQDSSKVNQGLKTKLLNIEPKKKSMTEKVKEALKEDFSYLLPLYQTEMKKVTDTWVNTIYGSLTMRSHLVKMLVDNIPMINNSQFQIEDERLLKFLAQAKAYTEAETENLILFIKSLLKSQNSAKEENEAIMEEKEIANLYSNDWSSMTKKLAGLAEETRKLQLAIPEEEKKKGIYEKRMKEKIRELEMVLAKKEEEINKLINQLTILRKKEISFRENIAMRKEDFNEVKSDIESLKSVEKEYQELKSSCEDQNEMYKNKIEVLESLLEEKKKTLAKEKEMKTQMQVILDQLQAQQQRLRNSIGSEQVDYIMGQTPSSREKSREQLWIAAIKLVLRGFLVQMKKLECDKNKMLLHLQANDLNKFKNTAATIVKKEQFMKSIVSQMIDFHKSCNYVNVDNCENAPV